MKEKLKKVAHYIQIVFGWGIMLILFVSGITFLGYLVAFFVGGETATNICEFIYKKIYPVMFYITSIIALCGLLSMYLKGEAALKPAKKNVVKKDDEKTEIASETKLETKEDIDTENQSAEEEKTEDSKETKTETVKPKKTEVKSAKKKTTSKTSAKK